MSAVIASPTAVLMGVENKHGAVKVLAPAAAAAAAATAVSNMMPIALMPAVAEVETASMVEVGCCEQQLTVYRSRPVPPPKPASLRGRPLCAMSSSAAPPWPTADNEEEQGDDLSDMVVGPLREVICEHHVCNGCIVNSRLPRSQSLDANLSRQQHQQQLQRTGVRSRPQRSETCLGIADNVARQRALQKGSSKMHSSRNAVTRSISTDSGLTINACLGLRAFLTVGCQFKKRVCHSVV